MKIAQSLRNLAVSLDSLNLDAANARKHNPRNLEAIKNSLAQFGQRKPVVVQREGMIVRAGNGTVEAARALGWTEIAAVVIDEDNTTAAQFAIADNRTAELAEWDTDTLAALLNSWSAQERGALGFEESDFEALLDQISDQEEKEAVEQYTRKVEIPTYEPKGEKPKISELTDPAKFNELQEQITESLQSGDITAEEADFLSQAAYRHFVFSYSKIAEYYCHANPRMQKLMENSALVIIDFNDAIANGFVKLSKQLADIVAADMNENGYAE